MINVGLTPGYAYADIPLVGFGVLVTTDGDPALAERICTEMADLVWSRREEFRPETMSVEEAVHAAMTAPAGPVVLADVGDNPGGGTACDGTGQTRLLPRLGVARHVRQMIRTCWELGRLPEFADLKLWKWAHMLGFRGHFSTKFRSYSTTLGALRDARRAWRTEQARARADLPEHDPDTTLVVGHWAYLGTGYSPGASLLAAAVWHRRELARQFIAEGGC